LTSQHLKTEGKGVTRLNYTKFWMDSQKFRTVWNKRWCVNTPLGIGKNFFTEKAINDWNKLPLEVKRGEDNNFQNLLWQVLSTRCKEKRD
jgi:hypothetical protein